MPTHRVIHVENIRHDPLLGRLSGTVIHRDPEGDLMRQTVTTPVEKPSLAHAEAEAHLRRAADQG
ncbi:hypothetical protein [Jannaschia seohaensis]|uniref:Uncharacterized protein n=1 Tax=Jannaschia seohaensis TaxID=475081 RepID=A0A2Y9AB92_9RHOB|nr:hypothetical protein [Jannaschia seohaensis]PWJ21336.1 hypothetical protein BCF38_102588 [Jannaschia seohaensis]SSA41871.1 hypothetical protein SAMN05421539_102588 [Jannaschia seohaensis]